MNILGSTSGPSFFGKYQLDARKLQNYGIPAFIGVA